MERYHVLVGEWPTLTAGIPDIPDFNTGFFANLTGNTFFKSFTMLNIAGNAGKKVLNTMGVPDKQDCIITMNQYNDRRRQTGVKIDTARLALPRCFRRVLR